mgnify:CR=1 FL=1
MGDLRPLADVLARVLPTLLDVDRGEHVWRVERQPPERRDGHHPAVPSRDDTSPAQHDPCALPQPLEPLPVHVELQLGHRRQHGTAEPTDGGGRVECFLRHRHEFAAGAADTLIEVEKESNIPGRARQVGNNEAPGLALLDARYRLPENGALVGAAGLVKLWGEDLHRLTPLSRPSADRVLLVARRPERITGAVTDERHADVPEPRQHAAIQPHVCGSRTHSTSRRAPAQNGGAGWC